jgi:capsular exopolysaccharide synthesis family protein
VEDQIQPTKKELLGLSLKDLFFKYFRFLPLFVISVALSLFVSYIYLRYATLVYRAAGSMVIRDEKSGGGSGDDKFEQFLNADTKKNIQNEIEVLRSRPLMERVVRALNLNFTYYAQGKIKELNIYKSSPFRLEALKITDSASMFRTNVKFEDEYSFRINDEKQVFHFGDVFQNQHGVFRLLRNPTGKIAKEYNVEWRSTPSTASFFASGIIIAPKANTGILVLSLEATNPELASDVINRLMREYELASVEDKNITTQQTLEFIDGRLGVVNRELDSIINRKLLYQQANNLINAEQQSSSYFEKVDENEKQINEHSVRLDVADMIQEYLTNKRNNWNTVPSSLGLEDPTLNTLISSYNVAQLERKQYIDNNMPSGHVLVRSKEDQIEKLRQNILENLRGIKSSYQSAITELRRKSNIVEGQIRTLPAKQQNLIEIERQQETKLGVFNFLMEERERSAISLASTISNSRVLEEANANYNPVKPNRKNARMLAIVIGLVLPALFIFVLELMNDKVTTRLDVERITSATILAEVGHSYNDETLVVKTNNRSVIAEQFRIIRSNLQYVLNNIKNPVVLITSSFSGEGKSFISTNIGAVMALAGKRTIVLEFDIRKPKVMSELHMAKKPGLTNFLLGKAALADLPVPVPSQENLFVLPCGPVPPNPAEMLLDPRLSEVFDYLKANFDVVIMDTAPVGMVSDAMTLSKFADATLYIVRQGHTYKRQIGLIDEFYRENKLPKVSIVLNDVKLRSGYGYYGYGRYGYGHGYTSGYFDNEEPPAGMMERWFGFLDLKKWNKKKRKKAKA